MVFEVAESIAALYFHFRPSVPEIIEIIGIIGLKIGYFVTFTRKVVESYDKNQNVPIDELKYIRNNLLLSHDHIYAQLRPIILNWAKRTVAIRRYWYLSF